LFLHQQGIDTTTPAGKGHVPDDDRHRRGAAVAHRRPAGPIGWRPRRPDAAESRRRAAADRRRRPALEKGTIDAAEWVGPYGDDKLGFNKVAPCYYYPSWWEGGTAQHFLINRAKWNELPKNYQAIVTAAAGLANVEETARYDARNPAALKL
jgi:hypothetical protein